VIKRRESTRETTFERGRLAIVKLVSDVDVGEKRF
jgi:hypothetical protein